MGEESARAKANKDAWAESLGICVVCADALCACIRARHRNCPIGHSP